MILVSPELCVSGTAGLLCGEEGNLTRRGAMGLLALGTGLLVSGCALISGESTYRFRMTVEVQTPQGLKSGSSVMEVSARVA